MKRHSLFQYYSENEVLNDGYSVSHFCFAGFFKKLLLALKWTTELIAISDETTDCEGAQGGRVRAESSSGGTFFKAGFKNLCKMFFSKGFTLTIDPILNVLLKLKQNLKCKSGGGGKFDSPVPPPLVRSSRDWVWGVLKFCWHGERADKKFQPEQNSSRSAHTAILSFTSFANVFFTYIDSRILMLQIVLPQLVPQF